MFNIHIVAAAFISISVMVHEQSTNSVIVMFTHCACCPFIHQHHHIHVCHAWYECECMMSSIHRVTATIIQPCLIMHEPPSLPSIPSSIQHHQHHHIHLSHTWFQQRHTTLNTHRDTRECMLYLIHLCVCMSSCSPPTLLLLPIHHQQHQQHIIQHIIHRWFKYQTMSINRHRDRVMTVCVCLHMCCMCVDEHVVDEYVD